MMTAQFEDAGRPCSGRTPAEIPHSRIDRQAEGDCMVITNAHCRQGVTVECRQAALPADYRRSPECQGHQAGRDPLPAGEPIPPLPCATIHQTRLKTRRRDTGQADVDQPPMSDVTSWSSRRGPPRRARRQGISVQCSPRVVKMWPNSTSNTVTIAKFGIELPHEQPVELPRCGDASAIPSTDQIEGDDRNPRRGWRPSHSPGLARDRPPPARRSGPNRARDGPGSCRGIPAVKSRIKQGRAGGEHPDRERTDRCCGSRGRRTANDRRGHKPERQGSRAARGGGRPFAASRIAATADPERQGPADEAEGRRLDRIRADTGSRIDEEVEEVDCPRAGRDCQVDEPGDAKHLDGDQIKRCIGREADDRRFRLEAAEHASGDRDGDAPISAWK